MAKRVVQHLRSSRSSRARVESASGIECRFHSRASGLLSLRSLHLWSPSHGVCGGRRTADEDLGTEKIRYETNVSCFPSPRRLSADDVIQMALVSRQHRCGRNYRWRFALRFDHPRMRRRSFPPRLLRRRQHPLDIRHHLHHPDRPWLDLSRSSVHLRSSAPHLVGAHSPHERLGRRGRIVRAVDDRGECRASVERRV